jgi:hypothetical protein
MHQTMDPAARRAPPNAASVSNLTVEAALEDVAVAAAFLVEDDDGVLPLIPAILLVGMVVPVLPLLTRSLDGVELAIDGAVVLVSDGMFVPVRTVSPLVEGSDTTGIVDSVGIPRMETVPDRSVVDAAFTSGLADRGKPKTLQMLAMAPKVATRREYGHKTEEVRLIDRSLTDLAGFRYRYRPDRCRH